MASSTKMLAVSSLLVMAFFGAAMAKDVHVNWAANVDYAALSANTIIVVGDRIFFDYPPASEREAVEVSEERFNTCKYVPDHDDPGVPVGDHGIELSASGTYYFINDFPGRCESGWKLRINVLTKEEAAARPPPSGAPFFPGTLPPPFPDNMPHRRSGGAPSALVSLSTLTFAFCVFIFSLFMH